MDTSRIPCYAHVLLWIHVAGAATVAPPTNVTLHCHNMMNTLSWGYDELTQGLRFKVLVGSVQRDPVTVWVDSPRMSVNLSEYSDPDNDYMVMVSVVKEGVESEPMPEDGIQYSYFKDSLAPVVCSLDLPVVSVEAFNETHIHMSFQHPGIFYPTTSSSRKKKSTESQDDMPEFLYHVKVLNYSESPKYQCTDRHCENKVRVDGSKERHCLNINGEMNKMSVQAKQMYCLKTLKPGINPLAYIIPIVLVLVGVVVVMLMVFITKIRPSTSVPSALAFPVGSIRHQKHAEPGDQECGLLEPSSPVPHTSSDQDTSSNGIVFRDEVRLPLGLPDQPEPEPEPAAGPQGEQGDGYTQGNCLDDNDEEDEEMNPSYNPYEPRGNPVSNQDEP